MAFLFVLGLGGILAGYFIYRWLRGAQNHVHADGGQDEGQDDIDGYRNENVEYFVSGVIKGKLNSNCIKQLKSEVDKYGDKAKVEYIGITSGSDPVKAMKSRVDSKKRQLGINCMHLLYETDSHADCTEAESQLIDYSQTIHKGINKNEVGGGGGRIPVPTTNMKYYVYVAYSY